jgi:hypothetical protein
VFLTARRCKKIYPICYIMAALTKRLSKILAEPSECAFHLEQGPVCSPRHVVQKIVKFVKARKGSQHSAGRPGQPGKAPATPDKEPSELEALAEAKEILNCNTESCVLKRPEFVKFAELPNVDALLNDFFKPAGPATHFGLLSNFNIDEVLAQLAKKHADFLHITYQMRDFEKQGTELARVNLAEHFAKPSAKFGVVLNTDWTSGRGIHWYCLFGEKANGAATLEYFNSSGRDPLVETQTWLHKTKHGLARDLKIPVDVRYTTGITFQNDEHSCGVYCLMYIWLRLEGIEHQQFKAHNFHDKLMHQARRATFRHGV